MIGYSKAMKVGIQLVCGVGICMILAGCGKEPEPVLPEFQPKALNDNARGITIASSKAYNCKIVGEMEGHDEVKGKVIGVTKAKIRRGAMNDLKNEAAYAIKDGQKVMISITKEEMRCEQYPLDKKGRPIPKARPKNVNCINWEEISDEKAKIVSYKVYADLYDCGNKQIH